MAVSSANPACHLQGQLLNFLLTLACSEPEMNCLPFSKSILVKEIALQEFSAGRSFVWINLQALLSNQRKQEKASALEMKSHLSQQTSLVFSSDLCGLPCSLGYFKSPFSYPTSRCSRLLCESTKSPPWKDASESAARDTTGCHPSLPAHSASTSRQREGWQRTRYPHSYASK